MAYRGTLNGSSLSQTSLAIIGVGVSRSVPFQLSSPMASLSRAIWGAGKAVALSCSDQGGHQFGNLVPQFHSALYMVYGHDRPSPYLIMGFFILILCLAGSNHELGISSPEVAIEVPYQISNVLADPMGEMIFEMLLDLPICYSSGALQPNLIEGPFQPCGKGGDLLLVTLCNFVKILH